ncbi:hypothetical protein NDU88_005649 [Pleurodeles waltl]|uniref:Uncharacterized protein n=1 Tax=Pleurodeles waltl TaxID=8319 RepID=A0AAV7RMY8_PLEWA|nr:hypothetical protein NDU88_005649 [Pleurodeles waltl]
MERYEGFAKKLNIKLITAIINMALRGIGSEPPVSPVFEKCTQKVQAFASVAIVLKRKRTRRLTTAFYIRIQYDLCPTSMLLFGLDKALAYAPEGRNTCWLSLCLSVGLFLLYLNWKLCVV